VRVLQFGPCEYDRKKKIYGHGQKSN